MLAVVNHARRVEEGAAIERHVYRSTPRGDRLLQAIYFDIRGDLQQGPSPSAVSINALYVISVQTKGGLDHHRQIENILRRSRRLCHPPLSLSRLVIEMIELKLLGDTPEKTSFFGHSFGMAV